VENLENLRNLKVIRDKLVKMVKVRESVSLPVVLLCVKVMDSMLID